MAMDEKRFVEVKSGQSWSSGSWSILEDGQHVCLTRVSLVDAASASGQGAVVASVHSDTWNSDIPIARLTARNAGWDMRLELVLDREFLLYVNRLDDEDFTAVDVRFDFDVLPQPAAVTLDHQQLSRRPWSVDLESGLTHRTLMKGRDRVCLTRVSLVDPERAVGQGVVCACVHTDTRDRSLAPLSAERPSVELKPVVVLDKEVYFYLNGFGCRPAAGEVVVRFEGYVLPLDTAEQELEDVAGEEVEEDYEYEEEEEDEESDEEVDEQASTASGTGDDMVHNTSFVSEEHFFGGEVPHFASAGSTAGFMRMRVAAMESQEDGDDDKQILVLYRHTRFSTASDGIVEARRRTKNHKLRFIMPPTGDMARSLPWAGASVANLVYPGGHLANLRKEVQELWSNLTAEVSVPPRAARIEVLFDVGILRSADFMPDSMDRMCDALEGKVQEGWTVGCDSYTGMELHLPEPVSCGGHDEGEPNDKDDGADGGERPAKRRRVVAAGEDCSVCLQLLEGDNLAAWLGCGKPHVFHGGCLELVLKESDMCPICRRLLYIEPEL